jgi:hypothetical protein
MRYLVVALTALLLLTPLEAKKQYKYKYKTPKSKNAQAFKPHKAKKYKPNGARKYGNTIN